MAKEKVADEMILIHAQTNNHTADHQEELEEKIVNLTSSVDVKRIIITKLEKKVVTLEERSRN